MAQAPPSVRPERRRRSLDSLLDRRLSAPRSAPRGNALRTVAVKSQPPPSGVWRPNRAAIHAPSMAAGSSIAPALSPAHATVEDGEHGAKRPCYDHASPNMTTMLRVDDMALRESNSAHHGARNTRVSRSVLAPLPGGGAHHETKTDGKGSLSESIWCGVQYQPVWMPLFVMIPGYAPATCHPTTSPTGASPVHAAGAHAAGVPPHAAGVAESKENIVAPGLVPGFVGRDARDAHMGHSAPYEDFSRRRKRRRGDQSSRAVSGATSPEPLTANAAQGAIHNRGVASTFLNGVAATTAAAAAAAGLCDCNDSGYGTDETSGDCDSDGSFALDLDPTNAARARARMLVADNSVRDRKHEHERDANMTAAATVTATSSGSTVRGPASATSASTEHVHSASCACHELSSLCPSESSTLTTETQRVEAAEFVSECMRMLCEKHPEDTPQFLSLLRDFGARRVTLGAAATGLYNMLADHPHLQSELLFYLPRNVQLRDGRFVCHEHTEEGTAAEEPMEDAEAAGAAAAAGAGEAEAEGDECLPIGGGP